jgi:hypothetical protein
MGISGGPNTQLRKVTYVEYNNTLLQAAIYTGPWRDSNEDGAAYVELTVFSSSTLTGTIQESDDINNTNFIHQVNSLSLVGGTLRSVGGPIKSRYWRIQLTMVGPTTTVEACSTASNQIIPLSPTDAGLSSNLGGLLAGIGTPVPLGGLADNAPNSYVQFYSIPSQASGQLGVQPLIFGGSFSGTAQATLQNWSRPRTPTVYKSVTTAAAGNTAVWTPGSGNKFRLLRFKVQVTANASLAAAGILTVTFQDATTGINLTHNWWFPAAAGAAQNLAYDSGWIDLGQFGVLSAAANNALNVNLSAALSSGEVSVIACGTEE